jgi:hypothetical protein
MKKLNNLILVCFVLLSTATFAQVTKYGIRAGVGIPNLKSTDDNIYSMDYKSVPGFDGSFFGDFGITEHFSIKAELGFSRKGGERNGMQPIPPAFLESAPPGSINLPPGLVPYAEFDNTAVFNYIEIPVLAKYEWDLGSTWGVYVNGGLYVDFIINPEQVTSGDSYIYADLGNGLVPVTQYEFPMTATTDIGADLANMDFGGMFGVGVTYAINDSSEILFDMRGSYGFIPLQNDVDTYGSVHMGNMTFALGYAYTIPKKAKVE